MKDRYNRILECPICHRIDNLKHAYIQRDLIGIECRNCGFFSSEECFRAIPEKAFYNPSRRDSIG